MGLLDLPGPLFQLVDDSLAFLPPFARLTLWSAVGGVLSMLFYALISPQGKISDVKGQLQMARRELATADDSFEDLLKLVKSNLQLSLKHLGLVFIPALISSLPLLCILAWASTEFGYSFPTAGAELELRVHPDEEGTNLVLPASAKASRHADSAWIITWPTAGEALLLEDAQGRELVALPPAAPVPQVHKRLWWNTLLGNPAGYLPPETDLELIEMQLPAQRFLPFGPSWVGNWLTLAFTSVLIFALLTKWLFKID